MKTNHSIHSKGYGFPNNIIWYFVCPWDFPGNHPWLSWEYQYILIYSYEKQPFLGGISWRPEESYCSEHQAAHGGVCHQRLQGGGHPWAMGWCHGLMPWLVRRDSHRPQGLAINQRCLNIRKQLAGGPIRPWKNSWFCFLSSPKASKNWTRALICLIFFPSSKLKFSKFSLSFSPSKAYPQAHPPCGRMAWFSEAGMVNARKELASLRAKVSIPFRSWLSWLSPTKIWG